VTASLLLAQRADRRGPAAERPIRLLIVDDSTVARAVLSRMIGAHADFELVATAGNADEALAALRSVQVDIVLLDIEMPGASGLEALPRILEAGLGARVLIVSSLAEDGAEAAVQALALGAADTLPKPGAGAFGGRFADILAERLRRIGRVVRRSGEETGGPASNIQLRDTPEWRPSCLAIGASTGGIHAINDFLCGLPAETGGPILVTQHLPPLFMPFFARQLEAACGRPAKVAEDDERLQADRIYVAPGKAHLSLHRRGPGVRVRLDSRPAPSGCLPSVDPMLEAVGEAYGRGGVAIILSGMGRDGLAGSRSLAGRGGVILAQDQASAAIWGMPKAVAEAGLATAVLPPHELARRVASRLGDAAWT
jgi:two-component system, chemotaxis family, protein-glutamate methylesterase/glutaminase